MRRLRLQCRLLRMRYVALISLCLSGCFGFYIPGSMFESGNTCVEANAYVGQRVHNKATGQDGKITKIIGRHQRCQSGELPILADVEY